MANIKETILNTLKNNILNIQKQNGYLSDIQNVFLGSSDIQNINSFPVCTIAEGNSKILKNFNAKGDELIEMDVLVKFYVEQTPDISNTVNSINIKADFKKLIYGDKNILINYLSTLHQIPEIKKIVIEQETGILEYNSKVEYTIVLLKIEYLSYADHIDGSSYSIVIPNVLSNYSLSSHQHSQYFLNSNSGSLTGTTINLSGYSLTSHTHTLINNNLGILGTLSLTGDVKIKGNFQSGIGNQTNAQYCFTQGYYNQANSIYSAAFGENTNAGGGASFVAGQGTLTNTNWQFCIGKWNYPNTGDLFQIGKGTSNAIRSNIIEVNPNYLNVNGQIFSQGNLYAYTGIYFDGDEFKSIRPDGESLIIHNYESDSSPVKIDAGIIVLQDAADNDKNVTIQKNTGTDSCIYLGENKFRIRYKSGAFGTEQLIAEAYYNGTWNESAVLGEI